MKCDSVWVSCIALDRTLTPVNLDFDPNEAARKAILVEKRDPEPDELPVSIFAKVDNDPLDNLPVFFVGGGYTFSGRIAAPFFKFDLGRNLILPVQIFLHDRTTEVYAERSYFTRLRSEVLEALAPEASPNLRPAGQNRPGASQKPPTRWFLPWEPQDEDVAVTRKALDSPAIWHDPTLINSLFINGEVVKALQDAGVAKYWQLKRCRIVD